MTKYFPSSKSLSADNPITKSLFVTICGAPNVGKSTLVNKLVEKKISIVSSKPQTTRNNIKGIISHNNTQIVFIDTPGLFKPKSGILEKKITANALNGMLTGELICCVIDSTLKLNSNTYSFLENVKKIKSDKKVICVISKIDLITENELLELAAKTYALGFIDEIFMISSIKNKGISGLRNYFFNEAKEDHWYYEPQFATDRNINFILSEITREKVFHTLQEELPYNIDVKTDKVDILPYAKGNEDKREIYEIMQTIYINKDSHKLIVIGKKGSMIKLISQLATREMESVLHKNVKLNLLVKLKADWIDKWQED